MTVLSDKSILKALSEQQLKISDIKADHIKPASVDLCLDANAYKMISGDVDLRSSSENFKYLEEEFTIPSDGYVLQPGHVILGYTKERISIPAYMTARIFNRNSCARLGLDVAIGCYINPGYVGKMLLVIRNFGTRNIRIYPDDRICQIQFSLLNEAPIRNYQNEHDVALISGIAKNMIGGMLDDGETQNSALSDFLRERINRTIK